MLEAGMLEQLTAAALCILSGIGVVHHRWHCILQCSGGALSIRMVLCLCRHVSSAQLCIDPHVFSGASCCNRA